MHVTRSIPAVLAATALALTSCSNTGEGGAGGPEVLKTNGDEVIQDAEAPASRYPSASLNLRIPS